MHTERALKLAIGNILKEGLTDIFPRPFEVDLLKNKYFATKIQEICYKRIKSGSLQGLCFHPLQHVLFPKKDPFDFRRAALIQPLDTITSLALAILVADEIERFRPNKRSKRVYSYRFKPNGDYLFDPKYTFTAFNNHVSQKAKSPRCKVLVKCDIASFYDRLNLHRLESTLSGLSVDKKIIELVDESF